MGEAVGQVEPYLAIVALEAEALFVAGLQWSDCYFVLESENWDGEGCCCG